MNIKKILPLFLSTTIISLLPFSPLKASELKLDIYPLANAPMGNCPDFITIIQNFDPYFEGGYTLRGIAQLGDIANDFLISSQDIVSTTWSAVLKSEYAGCSATGRITEIDGEYYDFHSHITVRFLAGQLILNLDLTGLNDANEYTPVLLETGVREGNPFWSWGGTD